MLTKLTRFAFTVTAPVPIPGFTVIPLPGRICETPTAAPEPVA